MKLLFFQNCVSPHQMPYIEVLAKRHDVTVVVPFVSYEAREQMGWSRIDESTSVRLVVAPKMEEVRTLFEQEYEGRTVALFSGISAFREVKSWFLMSLNYRVERGIITEAPYTFDKPLWMHKLRFMIQDLRYVRHIDYVFAIGRNCEAYYRTWSRRWRVIPFAYCVSSLTPHPSSLTPHPTSFITVGSLDDRKNVIMQLKALVELRQTHKNEYDRCSLTIVGDGPLRKDLEQFVVENALSDKVAFTGALPMNEARERIAQSQVLMLTSKHDGWGAVVNEALVAGTRVICTGTCGASALIDNEKKRGCVVDCGDVHSLAEALCDEIMQMQDLEQKPMQREEIRQWAQENIGPEAIAGYFEKSLC